VKDLEELQMDQKNLYGKEFTPIFLKELNKALLMVLLHLYYRKNSTLLIGLRLLSLPHLKMLYLTVIFKRNTERCNGVI
jgi:hypothetical protein